MHRGLAFLLSLPYVFAIATAAPLSAEVLNTTRVMERAKQLVVKINNNFRIPTLLTTVPPSGEQYGASSLVLILRGYNNLILDSFNGAPEVKAEIESLYGYVDQWKQHHCSNWPQPVAPRALVELRDRRRYGVGISYAALYRVREYLKNLLKNTGQLNTCT